MRVHNSTRYAALALLVGALACARNPEPDSDEAAAARDTVSDTLGGEAQNPPGYRGMERDTTGQAQRQPSDTFLDNQGLGTPQDTAGYSGMERVDTTGQANPSAQSDTAAAAQDTSGAWGTDSAHVEHTDTTGYQPSQQPTQDTTSAR